METERRRLFRHGTLLLLTSALMGLVVAVPAQHPAKWMAAHVSGLLTGILIIAFGALWSEVRLPAPTRRRAMRLGLTAAWLGVALNVYSAVVNLPGPATEPGRLPDAAWQPAVLYAGLIVLVPATIGSFFLVWRGLRD
jgi:(hydroxyamino)benzene mutase